MIGLTGARESVVAVGDIVEGRYRIIKVLGEGGMGKVFLAEHTLIKRRVAVKLMHPELAANAEVIERFMNEARAAGTLGHPNIVESTDMGFTRDHVPYIVFEYLEGTLLTDEIYRVGGFPVRRAVRIAQQIASALSAAHAASIIHRDLKSDNVFLTDKNDALDHVKVLDFGISRFLEDGEDHTRPGTTMGTPEFMAPEQITAADRVDQRTDVYALGVILYEMLAARRPFVPGDDPCELLRQIVGSPPPPLPRDEVPGPLADLILHKMLAKDPTNRYASMRDVELALADYAAPSEPGGLRRSRPTLVPPIRDGAGANTRAAPAVPAVPALALSRTDTSEQMSGAALPLAPPHPRPWWPYGVAVAGIVVGVLGFVIRARDAGDVMPTSPREAPTLPVRALPAADAPPIAAPAPAATAPGGSAPTATATAATAPTAIAPAAIAPAALESSAPAATPAAGKVELRIDAAAGSPRDGLPRGARVTFRRSLLPVPMIIEVNRSEIVEMVEVSATGYKTVRYWLTLDRPTHLTATMARGTGLHDATEHETLVALGEPAGPAAAPVPVAASPTPLAQPPRPARRKIGRSAETVIPVTVPAPVLVPDPAPTMVAEPAAAEVAPAPADHADPTNPTNPPQAQANPTNPPQAQANPINPTNPTHPANPENLTIPGEPAEP